MKNQYPERRNRRGRISIPVKIRAKDVVQGKERKMTEQLEKKTGMKSYVKVVAQVDEKKNQIEVSPPSIILQKGKS
ncbi:MAG: hypothetical protein ACHQ03_11650 [Candidatus Bathyarchaeia archaeon]